MPVSSRTWRARWFAAPAETSQVASSIARSGDPASSGHEPVAIGIVPQHEEAVRSAHGGQRSAIGPRRLPRMVACRILEPWRGERGHQREPARIKLGAGAAASVGMKPIAGSVPAYPVSGHLVEHGSIAIGLPATFS